MRNTRNSPTQGLYVPMGLIGIFSGFFFEPSRVSGYQAISVPVEIVVSGRVGSTATPTVPQYGCTPSRMYTTDAFALLR